MYSEYYTLRGLVLAEDKILTDEDKERLLNYLDMIKEDNLILTHNQSEIQADSFSEEKLQNLFTRLESLNPEGFVSPPTMFMGSSYLEYLKSKEEI